MQQPKILTELIEVFERLPGVGPKTALRYALALMRWGAPDRTRLAEVVTRLNALTTACAVCGNVTDASPCAICKDPQRDQRMLCVVAEPQDLLAIEKTGSFKGRYHVLGGVISPIDGVGPDQLTVSALETRIRQSPEPITELILAFDSSIDGETSMSFLVSRFKSLVPTISRLARGLPMGSDLEYADEITLSDALTGRRSFQFGPR